MKRLLTLCLLASTNLNAQERHPIDQLAFDQLQEAVSTAEMVDAQSRAYTGWDQLMNIVYKALREKMQPATFDALRASQRSWITYRDAEFGNINRIYYAELQGTMWRPVAVGARTAVVRKRVELLLDQYEVLATNYEERPDTIYGSWAVANNPQTRLKLREDFSALWYQPGSNAPTLEFYRVSDKCGNEQEQRNTDVLTFYKFGQPETSRCYLIEMVDDSNLKLKPIGQGDEFSFRRVN